MVEVDQVQVSEPALFFDDRREQNLDLDPLNNFLGTIIMLSVIRINCDRFF